ALWARVRRTITAFLTNEWRKGALFGLTPDQAFYVKCDMETNPPDVIDAGQLVCEIGVAPVKPAEFVIFRLAQFSGGAALTECQPGGNRSWLSPTSTAQSATRSVSRSTASSSSTSRR